MPMTAGMMFGSVTSGQLLSRGREMRILVVIGGTALLTAFYLLSTLEQTSAAWPTRGYMVLLGVGMGFWMPTFQLAVQNALPHRLLGTGTASVNFFRQFGATFGLAILGSQMLSTFRSNLEDAVPPQFGELLAEPERLLREDTLALMRARIEQASPGAADEVIQSAQIALGDAVTDIFLIGVGIVAVGLAIGLFMPRVRMRGREEMMEEAQSGGPPMDTMDEDEDAQPGAFGADPEEAGAPGGK